MHVGLPLVYDGQLYKLVLALRSTDVISWCTLDGTGFYDQQMSGSGFWVLDQQMNKLADGAAKGVQVGSQWVYDQQMYRLGLASRSTDV